MSTEVQQVVNDPLESLIEVYSNQFAEVLPSHIDSVQWIRQGLAAVRRDPKLRAAARSAPRVCLQVLMDCARLGHVPGTKEYYLIPRRIDGVNQVTGLEGYQGIVERIFRAGAANAVIVEAVYENDTFEFVVGKHDRPIHEVDWFGGERGELIGAYAYATMREGGTSKVVVMGLKELHEHRERSESWKRPKSRPYSPWTTDYVSMCLKTVARQLEKWVPTSNEFLRDRLRAAQEVAAERQREADAVLITPSPDGEVIDGEVVADPPEEETPEEGVADA